LTLIKDIVIIVSKIERSLNMSIFNSDRSTLNSAATSFDSELTACGFDSVLQKVFDNGMNLDEIMYVVSTHTEKTVRRYIVQEQLKKAANKEK
jgi:ethanolamine utilization protein EutQ (cupin superfamily)